MTPSTPDQERGHFFRLGQAFWSGRSRWLAWGLTIGVVGFMVAVLGAQVAINGWNRTFFDALELRNREGMLASLMWLPAIVAWYAVTATGLVVTRMVLQVRWREWLTRRLLTRWISEQRYYRLQCAMNDPGAPEYRIAEDARLVIDPLVELTIGLFTAVISGLTFAAILWQVAGSITLSLGGTEFAIPAYMALAAIAYAGLVSALVLFVGRPLVGRIAFKNEREARFRAEMTRLRENAESIALMRGDHGERASVGQRFHAVVGAWMAIIRRQGVVGMVLNTNGAIFPILPVLLVAPKYLSGALTLGAVVQVIAAFTAVQAALIWFVDNFTRIAEWYASVVRVDELIDALDALDADHGKAIENGIRVADHDEGAVVLDHVAVAYRNGVIMIADATARIEPGEKILLGGASGIGKSTLVRALAGLWPWGNGRISLPRGATIMFVPQRAYIPAGSLREVLCYPDHDKRDRARLDASLSRCGLEHLVPRLDDDTNWDQILSGGERQRLAFARVLVQMPDILILDEATSALDEAGQDLVMRLMHEELARVTIIGIGHRPGLEAYHDRKIMLVARKAGAVLSNPSVKQAARWLDSAKRVAKTAR